MINNLLKRVTAIVLLCLMVTSTTVWAATDTYRAIRGPETENKGENIYLGKEGEPKEEVVYSLNSNQAFPKKEADIDSPKWRRVVGTSQAFQKAISWQGVKNSKGENAYLPDGVDLDSIWTQGESGKTYRQKLGLSKYAQVKTDESGKSLIYDYSSRILDKELKDTLVKIVYNGASNPKYTSRLQVTYDLTFDQMRRVTQDAIWFFTDHLYDYQIKQEVSGEGLLIKTPTGPTPKKDMEGYTDSQYKAFLVLTGQNKKFDLSGYPELEEVNSEETLPIYLNEPKGEEIYQNLLGTEFVDKKTGGVIEREKTPVIFNKIDLGGKKLAGAKLEIRDASQKVIQSWISKEEKEIFSLSPGTYFLHEVESPKGYKKSEDLSFTVSINGEIIFDNKLVKQIIILSEKLKENEAEKIKVIFKKTDMTGRNLSGAELELKDAKGSKIKSWLSSSLDKTLFLSPGTYTLKEVKAPKGYKKAQDISFEVTDEGKVSIGEKIVSKVTMVNEASGKVEVLLNKVDSSGKSLSGAEIEVKDSTGKRIYLWTTKGKKLLMTLEPGTYTMQEKKAPLGYKLAKDIEFVLTDEGKVLVGDKQVDEVKMVNDKISRSLSNTTGTNKTSSSSNTSNNQSNKNPQTFVEGYGPHIGAMVLAGSTLVFAEWKRRKNK